MKMDCIPDRFRVHGEPACPSRFQSFRQQTMSSYTHIETKSNTSRPLKKSKVEKKEESEYEIAFKQAESIVPVLRTLWNQRQFSVYVGGEELTHASDASQVLKTIGKCKKSIDVKDVCDTVRGFLPRIAELKVASRYDVADAKFYETSKKAQQKQQDIVLYGFGRIGRLLARLMLERESKCGGPVLRAVVVRKKKQPDLFKRADLLLHDSVHGEFSGTVSIDEDENAIIANGNKIQIIYSPGPDKVDYTAYGINNAIVVDNTGIWRDQNGLSLHLKSKGVSKVLLTAPGKSVVNIVEGINDHLIQDQNIVSAASCSTNAAVPVLKVVHDTFGIVSGHIETIHSFTNDQNIIDNFHKKDRRGRAAPLNIILTSTGAGKAVAKVVPELNGRLTASAIRVPTPDVSILVMNLKLAKKTTVDSVKKVLHEMSCTTLSNQIDFVDSPEAASSDFVGNSHASIVDSKNLIVKDDQAVLYVWYDNEYGYSCQTYRLLRKMCL